MNICIFIPPQHSKPKPPLSHLNIDTHKDGILRISLTIHCYFAYEFAGEFFVCLFVFFVVFVVVVHNSEKIIEGLSFVYLIWYF